jgi:hypothetical protein
MVRGKVKKVKQKRTKMVAKREREKEIKTKSEIKEK